MIRYSDAINLSFKIVVQVPTAVTMKTVVFWMWGNVRSLVDMCLS
jgi:hypothetical protein